MRFSAPCKVAANPIPRPRQGASDAVPHLCPQRIGIDNKFIQAIYFSIYRWTGRYTSHNRRNKTRSRPILRPLYELNYAEFARNFALPPWRGHHLSLRRTVSQRRFCAPGGNPAADVLILARLFQGNRMVLFFHCSLPEHNSYRFA